jgi:hypothetical protein
MNYYSVIKKNEVIYRKMDRTGDYHVKQDKPDSERQISQDFSHVWNLDLKKIERKILHEYKIGTLWGLDP